LTNIAVPKGIGKYMNQIQAPLNQITEMIEIEESNEKEYEELVAKKHKISFL
jgi:hypothetical protein